MMTIVKRRLCIFTQILQTNQITQQVGDDGNSKEETVYLHSNIVDKPDNTTGRL